MILTYTGLGRGSPGCLDLRDGWQRGVSFCVDPVRLSVYAVLPFVLLLLYIVRISLDQLISGRGSFGDIELHCCGQGL